MGHRITGRYPGAVNRHHGIGWEFVHVCIDDASRIAFVQILADQRKGSAVIFPGGHRGLLSLASASNTTLEWVDWFNNRWLLEPTDNIRAAEAEANYYATFEQHRMAA